MSFESVPAAPVRSDTKQQHLQVSSVGSSAWQLLATGQSGCVVALYERSLYIEFASGLICVGLPSIGRSSLNVLFESARVSPQNQPLRHPRLSELGLAVSQGITVFEPSPGAQDQTLFLEFPTLRLSVARSAVWCGTLSCAWPVLSKRVAIAAHTDAHTDAAAVLATAITTGRQLQGVKAARSVLHDTAGASASASASAASLWLATTAAEWPSSKLADSFAALIAQVLPEFEVQLQSAVLSTLGGLPQHSELAIAQSLLGAGVGLTPAGDDFLSGVLLVLHRLQLHAAADRLWLALQTELDQRTHVISIAHLQQARAGVGSERADQVLELLLGLESIDDIERLVDKKQLPGPSHRHQSGFSQLAFDHCESMGHSSGWDLLAGFLSAFHCVACSLAQHDAQNATGYETC